MALIWFVKIFIFVSLHLWFWPIKLTSMQNYCMISIIEWSTWHRNNMVEISLQPFVFSPIGEAFTVNLLNLSLCFVILGSIAVGCMSLACWWEQPPRFWTTTPNGREISRSNHLPIVFFTFGSFLWSKLILNTSQLGVKKK